MVAHDRLEAQKTMNDMSCEAKKKKTGADRGCVTMDGKDVSGPVRGHLIGLGVHILLKKKR